LPPSYPVAKSLASQRIEVGKRASLGWYLCFGYATIMTSETELIERTYMVTPTVTGVPEKQRQRRAWKRKPEWRVVFFEGVLRSGVQ